MNDISTTNLEERNLPENIDYYAIQSDGSVVICSVLKANSYIGESDVFNFADAETMLYIRNTFGPYIGVMRDTKYLVKPKEYRTPKMLLGVVRGFG